MDSLTRFSRFCYRPDLGLLLIRLVIGGIFIHHGWMKLMSIPGTEHMMTMLGMPGFMAYAIMTVELVGGILLVLGVVARAAGVATGIAMIVALALAVVPSRGIAGGELELTLMVCSFALALIGAGKYRLLHLFEHDAHAQARAVIIAAEATDVAGEIAG